jgi:hypothetical protein
MKFTPQDTFEYLRHKGEQGVCKAIPQGLSLEGRQHAAKKTMRGLRSEFANTRQMGNSVLEDNPNVVANDDGLGAEAGGENPNWGNAWKAAIHTVIEHNRGGTLNL